MQELLASLTHAVQGTPALALGAAFVWGILSIVLSPCHLASIPLIVGFINEQDVKSAGRAFTLSLLFFRRHPDHHRLDRRGHRDSRSHAG